MTALLPPLLLGGFLRLHHAADQILVWDEVHTLRVMLETPLLEILRTTWYGGPVTAAFRLLLDQGVAPSELGLRVPSLLAGLASVALVPWVLWPRLGGRAAIALAWLLAVSPVLVLYSRIIHGYMPMVLLTFGAVVAFRRWWCTRSRGAAVAYVALAASAVTVHLGAGPFVLAPFGHAALRLILDGRPRADWMRTVVLLACVSVALASFLIPARASVETLVESARGGQLPDFATWLDLVRMYTGTPQSVLAVMVVALGVRGVWLCASRDRDAVLYVAVLVVGQVVGLAILQPQRLESLLVINRYLLVALPFGLAAVAVGATAPLGGTSDSSRFARAQLGAAIALALAVVATGPLASDGFRRGQLTHHPLFMNFVLPRDTVRGAAVPRFYRDLAEQRDDAGAAIIEFPWINIGSRAYFVYQRVHGRRMVPVPLDPNLLDARLGFRLFVAADPQAFLASDARWVVVHTDLGAEVRRLHSPDALEPARVLGSATFWRDAAQDGARLAERLRAAWGPPAFEYPELQVWDLRAIR